MKLIVCVDSAGGMLFNGRRQSSDRYLIAKILEITDGNKLLMDRYSRSLFPENSRIEANENYLLLAQREDYCFAEQCDPVQMLCAADSVILFCWNRVYPWDVQFPLDALRSDFRHINTEEFCGYSHAKITMEVYSR